MSRVKNKLLNGSNIPKAPSRADVEAMVKKRKEDEQKLIEQMHIPPRDEEKYPMPPEDAVKKAGVFIYTMGVLAESYDKNLQALIWSFYVGLMECLKRDSTQDELFKMIHSLTDLKQYLAESKNPLFAEPEKKP